MAEEILSSDPDPTLSDNTMQQLPMLEFFQKYGDCCLECRISFGITAARRPFVDPMCGHFKCRECVGTIENGFGCPQCKLEVEYYTQTAGTELLSVSGSEETSCEISSRSNSSSFSQSVSDSEPQQASLLQVKHSDCYGQNIEVSVEEFTVPLFDGEFYGASNNDAITESSLPAGEIIKTEAEGVTNEPVPLRDFISTIPDTKQVENISANTNTDASLQNKSAPEEISLPGLVQENNQKKDTSNLSDSGASPLSRKSKSFDTMNPILRKVFGKKCTTTTTKDPKESNLATPARTSCRPRNRFLGGRKTCSPNPVVLTQETNLYRSKAPDVSPEMDTGNTRIHRGDGNCNSQASIPKSLTEPESMSSGTNLDSSASNTRKEGIDSSARTIFKPRTTDTASLNSSSSDEVQEVKVEQATDSEILQGPSEGMEVKDVSALVEVKFVEQETEYHLPEEQIKIETLEGLSMPIQVLPNSIGMPVVNQQPTRVIKPQNISTVVTRRQKQNLQNSQVVRAGTSTAAVIPLTPSPIAIVRHSTGPVQKVARRRRIAIPECAHVTISEGLPVTYRCEICTKEFKTKAHIRYHEFCVSAGQAEKEKPFHCNECGKGFISKSHYTYHLRTHTGERPFVCKVCGKGFNASGKLTRHSRSVHTGERPLGCTTCGRRFSTSQGLKSHVLVHTGERPFPCNYCPMRFKGATNLRKHAVIHTGERPHVCKTCGKSFGLKWTLDMHAKTHTNLKPYGCDQCPKAFSNRKDLRRHQTIHSDLRPFVCSNCNVTFRRKDNLDRHVKNMHNQ